MSLILVVDDHKGMREMLKETLSHSNHTVFAAENGKEAIGFIKSRTFDIVITDLKMGEISGIDVLRTAKEINPDTQVVVMTAYGTVENAVNAMKLGAFDFVTKPFPIEEIELKVKKAIDNQNVVKENVYLKEIINEQYGELIGKSDCIKELFSTIEKASKSDATVLIYGESGTGKELVANAIHNKSLRANKPFIKVNCSALAEGVLESELFGHEKGSFTGAINKKAGRFELAHTGTLFLDEIGEFSSSLQVKLLRVLEEKEFERVGGTETIKADIRFISATNKNLAEEVKEGKFRNDLYYRINVIPILVPPLRDHKEDVPILTEYFLNKTTKNAKVPLKKINEAALNLLMMYSWPGNVRELENSIERACVLSQKNELTPEDFSWILSSSSSNEKKADLTAQIEKFEKESILNALEKSDWNQTKAGKLLGLSRTTLQYKISKYHIMKDNA